MSANGKSYMQRRSAQQRMTLSDLEWPFHASRAVSAITELLVLILYVCSKVDEYTVLLCDILAAISNVLDEYVTSRSCIIFGGDFNLVSRVIVTVQDVNHVTLCRGKIWRCVIVVFCTPKCALPAPGIE